MVPSIKPSALLATGAFDLMAIAGAVSDKVGRSQIPSRAPEGRAAVESALLLATGILFLIFCLALVRVFLRLLTFLETAIWNGNPSFVRFFWNYERSISFVAWTVLSVSSSR